MWLCVCVYVCVRGEGRGSIHLNAIVDFCFGFFFVFLNTTGVLKDTVEDGVHAEHGGQGGGGAQQNDRQESAGRRGEGSQGGQAAAAR